MNRLQRSNAGDELPVELVCVVSERDLAIVRYMLASLAISSRHFSRPPRIHVFLDHGCISAFSSLIEVPLIRQWLDVRVHDKSDYAAVLTGDGFRDQMLLKFFASAVVSTPYYWVVDCDYFFLSPIRIAAFMHGAKSAYAVQPWTEGADDTRRWRSASEAVLGEHIPLNGMIDPPYILSVAVARDLIGDQGLLERFRNEDPPAAEFVLYAGFALADQPDAHHWLTGGGAGGIRLVNQDRIGGLPRLSSEIACLDFQGCQAVVFWSHWDECESVMRRFLGEMVERERLSYVGSERLFAPYYHRISATELTRSGLRSVNAVYSDGWVHSRVNMEVVCDADSFVLKLEADWEATLNVEVAGSPDVASYRISPRAAGAEIMISLPGEGHSQFLSLAFANHKVEAPTGRRLVMREAASAPLDVSGSAGSGRDPVRVVA